MNGSIQVPLQPTELLEVFLLTTYSWSSGGGNSLTVSNRSAGTYTVTATDSNGCTGSASVTITQNNAITGIVSQSIAATCGQSNGSVMVSSVSVVCPHIHTCGVMRIAKPLLPPLVLVQGYIRLLSPTT